MPLYRHCSSCGAKLDLPAATEGITRQRCGVCGSVHYQNAKPCVGAVIVRDGKVLLARRAVEPFKGWWDLPGGFLLPWEHPADALLREVEEETGLTARATELLGIFVDRYGSGGDYTFNVHYLAEVLGGEPRPEDDVSELAWFAPEELPDQIAFENGRQALEVWRRRSAR